MADSDPQEVRARTGDRTVVYTDGACSGNPGPGGWAWAVPEGPFASGADAKSSGDTKKADDGESGQKDYR